MFFCTNLGYYYEAAVAQFTPLQSGALLCKNPLFSRKFIAKSANAGTLGCTCAPYQALCDGQVSHFTSSFICNLNTGILKNHKNVLLLLAMALLINSCKTYFIPIESFREQFTGMDEEHMKEVTVRGPVGERVSYKTYPIEYIRTVDKRGMPFGLKNSPSIEIRFTDTADNKTIFYFDLMEVKGDHISGRQSRFFRSVKKTISLASVKKIEVQNGRKHFRYINQR